MTKFCNTVQTLIDALRELPPGKRVVSYDTWLGQINGVDVVEKENEVIIWSGAA